MTELFFWGFADSWADNGGQSPDPVTANDTSWTWDVEFSPDFSQMTYARTSINSFAGIGGDAWAFSGIVAYRTRGADGTDTNHPIGQNASNGVADYVADWGVDDVTFGWGIEGDGVCYANVNMEIWLSS